jgi:hypothetical protein
MASNDLPARGSRALTGSVFRADFRPFYNILQAGSTSLEAARGDRYNALSHPIGHQTAHHRAANFSTLSHWRITERRVRQSRRVYGDRMRNNPSRVAMRRLLAKRRGQAEASHWGRRWRTVRSMVLSYPATCYLANRDRQSVLLFVNRRPNPSRSQAPVARAKSRLYD